jgi:uncharacterized repeat protein (TIGR01451 family)
MSSLGFKKIAALLLLILSLAGATLSRALTRVDGDNPVPAATNINNRASASYIDDEGTPFEVVSETVTLTVLSVSSIVVTPDETEPSASVVPNERVVRVFRVCNTGNSPDTHTITRAVSSVPAEIISLHFDLDASNTLSETDPSINLNRDSSPVLQPRGCIGVLAVVETRSITPNSQLLLNLTARSNSQQSVNAPATDDGTIINAVGAGARFTHPEDLTLAPLKLVEGKDHAVVRVGQTLNYFVSFRNVGDVAARNITILDELPLALEYIPNSLRLGQRALTDAEDMDEGRVVGRRLEVRLAQALPPGEILELRFQAVITVAPPGGSGIINTATISASNASTINTSEAVAIVNPFGTVYAARGGAGAPVAGARVSLLADESGGALVELKPDQGFIPNEANANPFLSNGQGHFSFALNPSQVGMPQLPNTYFLRVNAANYRSRLLEVSLVPKASNLFTMTVRSRDSLPLAVAGGFELTTETVEINNLAGLVLNIPMFETSTLEITKSVDRAQAEIGDTVSYRVEMRNATAASIFDAIVRDRLPASFHYAVGTATLQKGASQSQPIIPVVENDALIFQLGQLQPGERAIISYRVRIGANALEGEQVNTAIASGRFPNGETVMTPPAQATVRVGRGVFSMRQIILGRVFEDDNNNGQFDQGERAVEGVRLYLANGQSVVTDSQGMYNFPAVSEGALVISLDPVTLPSGYNLRDDGARSARSWTRLLRTPLGGGALLRQNFALRSSRETASKEGDSLASNRPSTSQSVSSGASQSASPSATQLVVSDSLPPQASYGVAPAPQKATTNGSDTTRNSVSLAAPQPSPVASLTPGTFEVEAGEAIAPVAPGEVLVLSPVRDEVIATPALALEARVSKTWSVALEVNGERIPDTSIGTTRVDHKNEVATYGFVGVNLRPGPNRVRVTATGLDNARGRTIELTVYGRGPATRLEIVPEKSELQASGRDSLRVRVRALDEWGHPAADAQVAIETSAGRLMQTQEETEAALALTGANINAPNKAVSEQVNANTQQQVVSLVGGEATITLIADNTAGEAKLGATLGNVKGEGRVRFTPEVRDPIMVSLAEVSIGRNAPEMQLRGTNERVRAHINLFYRGRFFGNNLLTLAYDSQQALNRVAGRDRIFQLDPMERAYPIFGDSSTRYEDAPSNSKLYVRFDRGRSYMMFGDMEADMNEAGFASYARKLTGVKFHIENEAGDFLSLTGARPDTSFARDVIPGNTLSLVQLSHTDLLLGSESVVIEVRDRRNPELILSRETLVRSVDYNLDSTLGTLLFLRPISAFDQQLNLVQVVVTYEHRADGLTSSVYTGRAVKRFPGLGLRLGLSFVNQRQPETGSFIVGGLDGEWQTPGRGRLQFDYAMSRGQIALNSSFNLNNADDYNGNAFRISLEQPLPFYEGRFQAQFQRTSASFFNPFGATATPGNTRGTIQLDLKPRRNGLLRLALTEERNRTDNVNNRRTTASIGWTEFINDRLRFTFGYDYRRYSDDAGERDVNSHLVTVGADWRVTDKLELSVKREQNLTEADPTYPTQTTFSATYQVKTWAKLFLTQRISSAPITPISDAALTGFAVSEATRETAVGIQTRVGRYTTLGGRYQLENGINGTDSFAVIGLQNRLPITKELSLEIGYERGFHLAGTGESFNSLTLGASWLPTQDFRSSARFELRDRNGLGKLFAVGAAGRLSDGLTMMARLQYARSLLSERESEILDGTAAIAWRPTESDRYGLLFSYRHRSLFQDSVNGLAPTRQRADALSGDGFYQLTEDLELYGRLAAKVSADGDPRLAYVSTFTYMAQARAQYRLMKYLDFAAEARYLIQPASQTRHNSYGAEVGFWVMPDLRLGGGYNFSNSSEPQGSSAFLNNDNNRRGFYFTISSKLFNLFDLFGTSRDGLQPPSENTPPPASDTAGGERP